MRMCLGRRGAVSPGSRGGWLEGRGLARWGWLGALCRSRGLPAVLTLLVFGSEQAPEE